MVNSIESSQPLVPDQLQHYLQEDHVIEVVERWQHQAPDEALAHMPSLSTVALSGKRQIRLAELRPQGEIDDTNTIVMGTPHQQAWKPSMFLRAELMRQIIAPQSRAIIFPNNSIEASTSYVFDQDDISRLHEGDFRPMGELQARTLEQLKVTRAKLTGYSLGGLSALAVAAVSAGAFDITHLNIDEVPSKDSRGAKQLQGDFMSSGGWGEQRAAIADARIPSLAAALSRRKLARDYLNFGLSTLNPVNKALAQAMAGSARDLLVAAQRNYPDMSIKIGSVAGSHLFDPTSMADVTYGKGIRTTVYTGKGTHKHPTGDNIVAHALMVQDGFQ